MVLAGIRPDRRSARAVRDNDEDALVAVVGGRTGAGDEAGDLLWPESGAGLGYGGKRWLVGHAASLCRIVSVLKR